MRRRNACQDFATHHQVGQRSLVSEPPCLLANKSGRIWQNDDCIHNSQAVRQGPQRWPTHRRGCQLSLLAPIRRETRERTCIVPTIAYQLALKCKSFADALHNAKSFDAIDHDVPAQLKDFIVGPWQQCTRSPTTLPLYLIVIDALDEINGDGGSIFLRDLLTAIDEYNLRSFKFLVTSRPDSAVVTLCKSFTSDAVRWLQRVPIVEAELDVGTYLKTKLPNLRNWMSLGDGRAAYSFMLQR
jgi:hypothetical protein